MYERLQRGDVYYVQTCVEGNVNDVQAFLKGDVDNEYTLVDGLLIMYKRLQRDDVQYVKTVVEEQC